MKRIFLLIVLLVYFFACKKNNSTDTTEPFVSYFADTSSDKFTGADTATALDLQHISFAEDIDTSLLPVLGKEMSPPAWSISMPSAGDQGLVNSCVGWSVGYGMLSYQFNALDGPPIYNTLDKIFSPMFIYNQLNNGGNNAISIPDALELVKNQGCCKAFDMPNFDNYLVQPGSTARLNASGYKLFEWNIFKSFDFKWIKWHLSKNYPLPFLAKIDVGFKNGRNKSSFEKTKDGRLVWKQYFIEPVLKPEYHAMVLCGYDDEIKAFKVLNSWGTGWGNEGYIWIDYDFFTKAVHQVNGHPEIFAAVPLTKDNKFPSVKIGNQVWMSKNLDVATFRNGDQIPEVKDDNAWYFLTTPAWCYYEHNTANGTVYGKLYNWYAVTDPRGLAPEGWHVSSDAEWRILTDYLGGFEFAGGKLKETGTSHWEAPNEGATNSTGFTALPGGWKGGIPFQYKGYAGFFWTTSLESIYPIYWEMGYNHTGLGFAGTPHKAAGYSVRCVKD